MMRPFDCLAAVRAMASPAGQHVKYAGLLSSSTLSNKDRVSVIQFTITYNVFANYYFV
jgi:hypothetical protein